MDYLATILLILFLFFLASIVGYLQFRKYKKYHEKLETVQTHINRIVQERYLKLKELKNLLKEEDQDIIPDDELPIEIRGNKDFETIVEELTETSQSYPSSEVKERLKEIKEMNEFAAAYLKYYNDNAIQYNKLLRIFPTNIIGFILQYKEKKMF